MPNAIAVKTYDSEAIGNQVFSESFPLVTHICDETMPFVNHGYVPLVQGSCRHKTVLEQADPFLFDLWAHNVIQLRDVQVVKNGTSLRVNVSGTFSPHASEIERSLL